MPSGEHPRPTFNESMDDIELCVILLFNYTIVSKWNMLVNQLESMEEVETTTKDKINVDNEDKNITIDMPYKKNDSKGSSSSAPVLLGNKEGKNQWRDMRRNIVGDILQKIDFPGHTIPLFVHLLCRSHS